jgi:hypothetical protein
VNPRNQRVGVVVLALIAVALVFVASAVKSYVPLFFVWIPQLGIPVFLSRTDPKAPEPAPATAGAAASDAPDAEGAAPTEPEPRDGEPTAEA